MPPTPPTRCCPAHPVTPSIPPLHRCPASPLFASCIPTPSRTPPCRLNWRLRGIHKLIIAGIQTEFCVDTTTRRAYSLGYQVTLVQDAHSTWDTENITAAQIIAHHNLTLGGWFAKLCPAAEVAFYGDDARLIPFASARLPQARLSRAWNLVGGMSAQMTALEGKAPDGALTRCVLRCPGAAQLIENPTTIENEYCVLQLGQTLGLPMPTPLLFLPPGVEFSTACLVMEYVEGGLDSPPAHLENYLAQMAGALAQIHAATCGKADLAFLPRQVNTCPEALPEIAQPADLPSGPILAALRAHPPASPANLSALLHGDYWPGNLLWQNGQLKAVIDWEDASLGDPLIDLGIARLEVVWMFGPPALPLFTQAYAARNPLDFSALPYRDLCAALRLSRLVGSSLAAWAASFTSQGRADLTAPLLTERFDRFVAQALENSSPLRRSA